MNGDQLFEAIRRADIITLFRHKKPDCDALGAQFGLKQWIEDNYPDKEVYALGWETCSQGEFPAADVVDDDTVYQSTAIVLDTATKERGDDQRFLAANQVIKIDHHPPLQNYGDLNLVNEKAAATCEILADFFRRADGIVSSQTAEYLYSGLLTDTLRFSTSNTTADTLQAGAWLAGFSIDIPAINQLLFDRDRNAYLFEGFLHEKAVIHDHLAYAIVSCEEQKKWHLSANDARNFIDVFSGIKEFEAWALFTEVKKEDGSYYDGSLRSKRIVLNEIAADYHGGGHKNASGVKNMTIDEVYQLIERLEKAIDHLI